MVNVILVDFRGIDTLGEITVLAIAAAGVANLVRAARRDLQDDEADPLGNPDAGGDGPDPTPRIPLIGARSVIFDQLTRALFPVILVVSLYIALRGHNAPGGGFAGGLIAGIAFAMRFLAGGSPRLRRDRPLPTSGLIGCGLLLALASGLVPMLFGDEFLDSEIAYLHVPLIGEVELVSAAVFDLGVYVLVLGVVLSFLTNLGAEAAAATPLAPPRPRPGPRGERTVSERSERTIQHGPSDGRASAASTAVGAHRRPLGTTRRHPADDQRAGR